jgi:predicted SprT family Zn-dependent metalloprotease
MDSPGYDDIATHDDLVAWSRAYAREVRRDQFVDVRFDLVDWAVSTRAKRRAGALKRPQIEDASVGTEIDWESAVTVDGRAADGRPFPATLSVTWDAFEAFERAEWESTIRHELVHLEQYQAYGTTDHGPEFKDRAADLDTGVHCEVFTDPAYVLRCSTCAGMVAHRYRECKLVRRAEDYQSSCCDAPLVVDDARHSTRRDGGDATAGKSLDPP